jgi:hypothetical protein
MLHFSMHITSLYYRRNLVSTDNKKPWNSLKQGLVQPFLTS